MRIAQIAPLMESCPPKLYGGTERIVSYLTEDLVALGHDVTLFASGDSQTKARLVAPIDRAIRTIDGWVDGLAYQIIMLHQVALRAAEFDAFHFHIDFTHFASFEHLAEKTLTTMHGRLDIATIAAVFKEYPMMPLVSISDAQRIPVPAAHWVKTVYHGLPADAYTAGRGEGGYLAFVGRISPEKRPDRAVAIARASGVRLRVAAKVDAVDRAYYDASIAPLFADPLVEFVGEIGEDRKSEFYGGALGLVFPIDWPEPFGLVMIEAMACGTPVIAFRHGSVEEILEDGVTGFIVDTVHEAVAAVAKLGSLDRRAIRRRFEERFAIRRVSQAYLELYGRMSIGSHSNGTSA